MKKQIVTFLLVTGIASQALALDVTNLDNVEHRVLFESAGSKDVHVIQPGDTDYFAGDTSGILSLLSAQNPKPSQGTLHSDGLLSGVIGAERTESIPADAQDTFAIWPGGQLNLQGHRKDGRFNH